jgi:hypothetical protein
MKRFPKDEKGWQGFWVDEIAQAKRRLNTFHTRGEKTHKRYIDDRGERDGSTRLNLFHSNVTTLKSMMFGALPKIDVGRTFQDPDDDVGRVAAIIMQRLLTNDIAENGREYTTVLRSVLEDRLVPGLGCARVRYVAEFEGGEEEEPGEMLYEDAPTEYFHWRDVLWGWCRCWDEMPWLAYRTHMSEKELEKRFGKEKLASVEYKQQIIEGTRTGEQSGTERAEQMEKVEVYEIWHKDSGQVFWIAEGTDILLDKVDDPLNLKGFYPSPPFLMANCTTSLLEPIPDFYIVQDLYNEIDVLEQRIHIITKAVKLAGVYDGSIPEIARLITETMDNDLVPVENWALFSEKSGLKGVVDWFPLEEVVTTLQTLEHVRDSKIALLFQVIGLSDIMRGMGTDSSTRISAAEQQLKAKFGSVRVQAMQDQFAQFATDLMQIKSEVICRHFDEATIGFMATIKGMPREDLQYVPAALKLIKNCEEAALRVKIRPESVAMTDYAQLQQERTQFISNLALFMQSAAPLTEQEPTVAPFLLEMLKWGLASFKGGNEIEGVIDRAIDTLKKKPPKKPEEDNSAQVEQMKSQAKMQQIQASLQADLKKIQASLQADLMLIQAKTSADGQSEVNQAMSQRMIDLSKLEAKIMEIDADTRANVEQTFATLRADKERIGVESRARKSQTKSAA